MRKILFTIIGIALTLGIFIFPSLHGIAQAQVSSAVEILGFLADPPRAIAKFLLVFMGNVLLIAGNLLNFTVEQFINQMGPFVNSLDAIQSTWEIFRDFSNIFFIFVILYAAIMIIIDASFSWQKILVNIVLAALFINFSLFITKAVIDVSNILALQFYNATIITTNETPPRTLGIADTYMQVMRVPSVMDINSGTILITDVTATSLFMASFLLGLVAFIFFAGAALVSIRFIYMIFLMILSPFAFVAMILPQTESMITQKWWSKLLSQAFFAPVFMAMLYVVARFIGDPSFQSLIFSDISIGEAIGVLTGISSELPTSDSLSNFMRPIVGYMIASGMLVSTLLIAQKMGAAGSSTVMGWGKSIQRAGMSGLSRTRRAVTSTAIKGVKTVGKAGGVAARATIGSMLQNTVKNYDSAEARLRDKAEKGGTAAKVFYGLAKATGLNVAGKKLATRVEGIKYGTSKSYGEVQAEKDTRQREVDFADRRLEREDAIRNVINPPANTAAGLAEQDKLVDEVRKMSNKELEDLAKNQFDTLKDMNVAAALSNEQLKKLTDILGEKQVAGVRAARAKGLEHKVNTFGGLAVLQTRTKDANGNIKTKDVSAADIANLPESILNISELAKNLGASQLTKMVEEGVSEGTRTFIRTQLEDQLINAQSGSAEKVRANKAVQYIYPTGPVGKLF